MGLQTRRRPICRCHAVVCTPKVHEYAKLMGNSLSILMTELKLTPPCYAQSLESTSLPTSIYESLDEEHL
ncbi:hypothetical protein J6590_057625 [Homalodisca vitripennis]|nr:hypothetical protein J6590_057625 [Homalodisca vitripennis]